MAELISQVRVCDVLLHHALGVEERTVDGDGMLHDLDVEPRLFVKHRKNYVFQFPVERFGFLSVVRGNVRRVHGAPRLANRPSRYAFDVAFYPPAVENAQAGNSVERGFHAACAGGFERKLRRVEPKIYAGSDFAAEVEIVLVEEDNGHGLAQRLLRMEDSPDNILASAVVGMRLARVDDLEMSCVLGDLAQAVQIRKDQVRALVARGAPSKTDCEDLFVQTETGFFAHGFQKFVLGDEMRRPDFFGRKSQRAAETVIVLAPLCYLPVEELLKRRRGPRSRVNAVGYGLDRNFGKHLPRSDPMLFGYAVDVS